MQNPYMLSKEVTPIKYFIELTPSSNNSSFTGNEKIELNLLKETNEIRLNIKEVKVDEAFLNSSKVSKIKYDEKLQIVILKFDDKFKGNCSLSLKFSGKIKEDMRGIYKSNYVLNNNEKKSMISTQFEPNDARACFPCFDEPSLKAKFNLTLITPRNLDAISNMPIKSESIINNSKKIIFNESPIMSTYLLAFAVGNFEHIESKTKNNILVRVITTSGKRSQGKFALDIAVKCLEYYEDYFNIPYPLPKLDLMAVPEFESGAMENWGLITYREAQLLFDEQDSSAGVKEAVALTVSHEIAHQWFGNLVTMKWWNDLWLNEGFASWIEYKAVDSIFPEWDLWTKFFSDEVASGLSLDSLNSSHPIEAKVINPDEISEIFDSISYNKGAAIIRMLEQYLSEKSFREGLRFYLNKFKYGNATTEDLWMSLQKISGKQVKNLMDSWTKQTGYPIIKASIKNNKLELEQERFLFLKNKNENTLWKIPLLVSYNNKNEYYDMDNKKLSLNINSNLIKINSSQVGFYRVNYSNDLFNNLLKVIKKLPKLDKINIENNVFTLCRANYNHISNYLELLKDYKDETDVTLWEDITINLSRAQFLFAHHNFSKQFDDYVLEIYDKILKKLGWDPKKTDTHNDILLRSQVLAMTGLSNHKDIIKEANKRFNNYLKTKQLNPNIRGIVYSLSAFSGDSGTYNKLLKLYRESNLQEEKYRLLASLTVFKQKELISKTLKFSLSDEVKVQDKLYAIAAVSGNTYAKEMGWEFFKDNFKEIFKMYKDGMHMLPNISKAICAKFSSMEKYNEVREFFNKNKIPNGKLAIEQALEAIKINYNFVKHQEINLRGYLRKF
ncbi:MAG: M1 family metallopeptidase [Nanoarchaeota archaeon]